jgi:hypothetical protein
MLDAMFSFIFEVIAFHLGRFYLLALTFGRFNPCMGDRSQPLVSLFGGLVTLALLVGLAIWVNQS